VGPERRVAGELELEATLALGVHSFGIGSGTVVDAPNVTGGAPLAGLGAFGKTTLATLDALFQIRYRKVAKIHSLSYT